MPVLHASTHEFKAQLDDYLAMVKDGHVVAITDGNRELARLLPAGQPVEERLQALVEAGLAEWSGESLPPVPHRPRVQGDITVSELIIANRD